MGFSQVRHLVKLKKIDMFGQNDQWFNNQIEYPMLFIGPK
jgi:hypothetical protein